MNTNFNIIDMEIEGVKLITPFFMEDERGYFLKSFEKDVFKSFGLAVDIFEDFESYSKKGVIRGMHFQTSEPQVKIVRAIDGIVRDVIVDLRKDSKSFGKYIDVILSSENHHSLWVPKGFAHGFEVLSETAVMSYKCIGKYLKGSDTGIVWNDLDLGITWNTSEPIVSAKDQSLMSFQEFINRFEGL